MLTFTIDNDKTRQERVLGVSIIRELDAPVTCKLKTAGTILPQTLNFLANKLDTKSKSFMNVQCQGKDWLQNFFLRGAQMLKDGSLELVGIRNVLSPSHLQPRNRIYLVETLSEAFIKAGEGFLLLPNHIRNLLARQKLDKNSFILQYGIDNYRFVLALLVYQDIIFPGTPLAPTGCMGSEKFKLAGANGAVMQKKKDNKFAGKGFCLHRLESLAPIFSYNYPIAATPGPVFFKRGNFTLQAWNGELGEDIPFLFDYFGSTYFIFKREDYIYEGYGGGKMNWDIHLYARSPDFYFQRHLQHNLSTPILAGKVKKTASPLLEIELEGFESGYNLVPCYPLAAYSGKDEDKGIHLIPEQDSRVAVGLFQNFQSKAPLSYKGLLLGNIRHKEARLKSPSFYLEDVFSCHYDEKMQIQSSLQIDVVKEARLKCGAEGIFKSDTSLELEQKSLKIFMGNGKIKFDQ